jgi:hypothetical protein
MTWNIHPGHRNRTATLVVAVGAALVASLSIAPLVGALPSSNKSSWEVEPSPDPARALSSALQAVSCSGPGSCAAVGSATYPSGQVPNPGALIEQLSDGTWTVATTPVIPSETASSMTGVSCPVAAFCVAVGSVQFAAPHPSPLPVAEAWNGTSWSDTILPIPANGSDPSLLGVSCAAEGSCVAVGNYFDTHTGTYRPLVERLSGSKWSVLPAPTPPHGGGRQGGDSEFTAVDCVRPTECEVVGDVAYNDTLQNVFAYALSGSTWTLQHQFNPGPDPGNSDSAVSCSAVDACTSVGTVEIVGELALAEYWDGSTWVRQTIPVGVDRPNDSLSGVSCEGGSSCVAVGESYRVDQKNGHLIDPRAEGEVWNGEAWSRSRPVVPSGVSAALEGISCPSPTACIAVGGASTWSSESTLVESYEG